MEGVNKLGQNGPRKTTGSAFIQFVLTDRCREGRCQTPARVPSVLVCGSLGATLRRVNIGITGRRNAPSHRWWSQALPALRPTTPARTVPSTGRAWPLSTKRGPPLSDPRGFPSDPGHQCAVRAPRPTRMGAKPESLPALAIAVARFDATAPSMRSPEAWCSLWEINRRRRLCVILLSDIWSIS